MRMIAHFYYANGKELMVYMEKRRCFIFDQHGNFPESPVTGRCEPHPSHGQEDVPDYSELGLYYGYDMPDTGWSGDC